MCRLCFGDVACGGREVMGVREQEKTQVEIMLSKAEDTGRRHSDSG